MPVELCVGGCELCACGAACMLTVRSSAAVLSEKRAAASCARGPGSSATSLFVWSSASGFTSLFLAWYEGSTKTKSLLDAELFSTGFAAGTAAFGADRRSMTRGENGDMGRTAGTFDSAVTVFAWAAASATALP